MLNAVTPPAAALRPVPMSRPAGLPSRRPAPQFPESETSRRIAQTLALLAEVLSPQRRVVHAGDAVYQVGEKFTHLHVLNAGVVKIVNLMADGREQVVGLKLRGDWLGFDGIAGGQHSCDAIAIDTGEVWSIRYEALLAAVPQNPQLLTLLHSAMGLEIERERDSLTSLCTLQADARVADFLHHWAQALAQRGLRTDQITLRMTRAEIGNYLGLTLETVSRAMSRLARYKLISFPEKGRRDIHIPVLEALAAFVQQGLVPASAPMTLQ